MPLRFATTLLLICACLPVAARDYRMSGADGDGGSCPEATATGVASETPALRAAKRAPAGAVRHGVDRGPESEAVVRPPRWHSFLPGMFR